jgi:hypothetical protein
MKGYDECNTILLPPRKAGDQLPGELSEHFYEQEKSKEEDEKKRVEAAAKLFDDQLKSSQMDVGTSPHSELSHSGVDEETAVEDPTKIPQETAEITKGIYHAGKKFPSGITGTEQNNFCQCLGM